MTPTQTWDPAQYAANARFVADLGMPVVDLLAPQPGERILDLGCGDGALTEKLAALGCEVIGVDSSPAQVAAAVARGIDARVVDARQLDFAGEFDAVFSNAALHWILEQDAVLAGVWWALRPGGRFVAEMGGLGNVAAVVEALADVLGRRGVDVGSLSPWYFPAEAEQRGRLETLGFQVRQMSLFSRPTPLPGDIGGWLETFGGVFLAAAPAEERMQVIQELRTLLRPCLLNADGIWVVDYVRLRFAADKPCATTRPRPL